MSKLLDSGGRILVATGPLLAQTLSRVYSLVLGACALALPRPDMYVTLLGGRSARRLVAAGPNYPPVEIWAVPSPPRLWGCGVIGNARLGYLVRKSWGRSLESRWRHRTRLAHCICGLALVDGQPERGHSALVCGPRHWAQHCAAHRAGSQNI